MNGENSSELDRRGFLQRSSLALVGAGVSRRGAAQTASTPTFFPGFASFQLETAAASIHGVRGGTGPALFCSCTDGRRHTSCGIDLLAKLAAHGTVVATDLRGYGDSSTPPDGRNHEGYSKRATARDQVEVMQRLGFERFAVVGHDRGARVGHRMALDFPESVTHLAALDVVPTHKLMTNVDKAFATVYFHWFLLAQPAPLPETLLGSSADYFLDRIFRRLMPDVVTPEAYAEYLRCFKTPATLHAMCRGLSCRRDDRPGARRSRPRHEAPMSGSGSVGPGWCDAPALRRRLNLGRACIRRAWESTPRRTLVARAAARSGLCGARALPGARMRSQGDVASASDFGGIARGAERTASVLSKPAMRAALISPNLSLA